MIVTTPELHSNALPPKLNSPHTYGYLNLTPTALTFTNNLTQNVTMKINFWGIAAPSYLQLNSPLHFDVVTPNLAFKQYLIDTRITSIEIVDSRNYKCIAAGFVNWLSILRSINDQTLIVPKKSEGQFEQNNQNGYYLPFFDQELQVGLDLLRVSEKEGLEKAKQGKANTRLKIGELKLQISSKVFAIAHEQRQAKQRTHSKKFTGLNEMDDRKKTSYAASRLNIEINNEESPYPGYLGVNESFITNKSLAQNGRQFSRKSGIISIHEAARDRERQLTRVREEDSNNELQSYQRSLALRSNLDLELMRVRMEMDQLVGLTEKEKVVTLCIKCFEGLNKLQNNKPIPFIDVTCLNTNARFRIYANQSTSPNKVEFGSCLAFPKDTRLLFVANLKKQQKERVIKGELSVNLISQSHQLSLLSSDGVLEGILHITCVAADPQIEHKPVRDQNLKEPNYLKGQKDIAQTYTRVNQQKPYESTKQEKVFASTRQEKVIGVEEKQMAKLAVRQRRQKSYYILFLIQKKEDLAISYKVMNKPIPPAAGSKFVILDEDELMGRQLTVSVHRNDFFLSQHTITNITEALPTIPSNLTCQLIKQQYLPSIHLLYQLYAGSLPQINYLAQQLTNPPTYPTPSPQTQHTHNPTPNQLPYFRDVPSSNKESENQGRIMERDIEGIQSKERGIQLRKLKTEQLNVEQNRKKQQKQRRITTEGRVSGGQSLTAGELMTHNQQHEHELNPSEHQHNDNIYLVDLMTRFLHSLSSPKLQPIQPMPLPQFLEYALKQDGVVDRSSQFREQKELIELVASIFQEDPDIGVDTAALKQSHQAYSTFQQLYAKQLDELMGAIKREEPSAFENIRMHCQLGMVNEHILWGRSLPRVTSHAVRERVSKFYRISHYGPTDAQFLLQDLEGKSRTELRQLDISNLGILIRQSVQRYISNAQVVSPQIVAAALAQNAIEQNWINIRGLNVFFETLFRLKNSLWESLMLIQEIKVCYGCDLQAEEGLISVDSVAEWVTTVQNRPSLQPPRSMNQSKASERHVAVAKNERKREEVEVEERSRGNQSYFKNENNDSQIFDIANLLRKREEQLQLHDQPYNIMPVSQHKSGLSAAIDKTQHRQPKGKGTVLLDQLSQDDVSVQEAVQKPASSKVKTLGVNLKQIKFYEEVRDPARVKIEIGVDPDTLKTSTNSYFYLCHYDQTQGHCSTFVIDEADRPSIWIKAFDRGELKGRSGVLWEQYCDSLEKASVSKTVVIYSSKGVIVGKAVIEFQYKLIPSKQAAQGYQQPNKEESNDKAQTFLLEIKLVKSEQLQNTERLYVKISEQNEEQELIAKEGVKLKIREPIYCRQLQVENHSRQYGCTIPLEQLFLRRQLTATYPLITYLNCTFMGNLSLAIRILPLQTQPSQPSKTQEQWPLPEQEHDDESSQEHEAMQERESRENVLSIKRKGVEVQKGIQVRKRIEQRKEQEEVTKRIDSLYKQIKAKYSK